MRDNLCCRASSTSSITSRAAAKLSQRSFDMPTRCDPWPGNMNATPGRMASSVATEHARIPTAESIPLTKLLCRSLHEARGSHIVRTRRDLDVGACWRRACRTGQQSSWGKTKFLAVEQGVACVSCRHIVLFHETNTIGVFVKAFF